MTLFAPILEHSVVVAALERHMRSPVLTLGSTIMLEHRLSSYMLLIEWSAIPLNIWWEDKGNATKYKVLVGEYYACLPHALLCHALL